ncbi:MAG: dienelactone hydrolase family protein, partial [Casimicrobiaceae bacterium]
RHAMWRDWLLERGFTVVFPLSFTARGLADICTVPMGERRVRPRDRVADVLATVTALGLRPDVDATRLVLWGFSHGGSTVLATLAREPRARGLFRQAIAFYPGCSAYAAAASRGERLALAAPLAILIGEADDWTPAAPCRTWVESLTARGETAEIEIYPGAYHDFDNPGGRVRLRREVPNGVHPGRGVTVGPNPAAREAAKQRVAALLAERGLLSATAR